MIDVSALLGTNKGKILSSLFESPKKMTDLKKIVSSYDVLRYIILELEQGGYISRKETFDDKRKIVVSLTDKGRQVAEQLKKAQAIAEGKNVSDDATVEMPENWAKKWKEDTKNLSLLYHVNVFEDHVTIGEDKDGRTHVHMVYVRINGRGIMRLWCEDDDSYECIHVQYAWTLPLVQEMYSNNVKKGNASGK